LNKIQISPERLMKNEELTTIRGGYGSIACYQWGSSGDPFCGGALLAYINCPCSEALSLCNELYGGSCVLGC